MLGSEMGKRREKWLLAVALLGISLLYFLLTGDLGYVEFRDSPSYMSPTLTEGVLWLYPLFLNSLRIVAGEISYLYWAAAVQSTFAALSVTVFVLYIGQTFRLKTWEYALIWLATLLPYSTELPAYLITHSIQTESLTFSFFYWYAICACEVLRCVKWKALAGMYAEAFLMASTRPQMILLFGLSGLLLIYVIVKAGGKSKITRIVFGIMLCGFLSICGLLVTYKIRTLYMERVTPFFLDDNAIVASGGVKGDADDVPNDSNFEKVQGGALREAEELKTAVQSFERRRSFIIPDQLGSAVFCRAFIEADQEDEAAFTDDDERTAFVRIYQEADSRQMLYQYAQPGLKMWTDLTQNKLYEIGTREIKAYLRDNYPEYTEEQIDVRFGEIRTGITLKMLSKHFGRFCYHCFRLMIPGWIACVFFNIYSIYLFCHVFVLFLYISAIGMAIWILKKESDCREEARFLLASVCSCFLFVVIVNIVFFGMQRYFIYNMGVFWCAYYLNFRIIAPRFWRHLRRLEG